MRMRFISCICICVFFFLSAGCRTVPVKNFEYQWGNTNNQKPYTLKQVRNAIMNGCADKDWVARDVDQNTIAAKILVRQKHEVCVTIIYSTSGYTIQYDSSVNMDYTKKDGVPHIHSSYTRWVNNLDAQIRRNLMKSAYAANPIPESRQ